MLSIARKWRRTSEAEKKVARNLILLGRKHGKQFLGLAGEPMLGLLGYGKLVSCICSEEARIAYLRNAAVDIARELRLAPEQIFIRYSHQCRGNTESVYEYTTALPISSKRVCSEADDRRARHIRWLYDGRPLHRVETGLYLERLRQKYPGPSGNMVPPSFTRWHLMHGKNEELRRCEPSADNAALALHEGSAAYQEFLERQSWFRRHGELVYDRADQEIEDFGVELNGLY